MNGTDPSRSAVHELIGQREQLRAWLARLDEVGTRAPGRVAERVRGDYEDRLRRVDEELGTHLEELEEGLADVRAALVDAEGRRERAQDALEEMQLRHLIGELDEVSWDDTRPALEGEVADADEALGRARDEVERLSRLVADVAGEPLAETGPDPADLVGGMPEAAAAEAQAPVELGGADSDEWEPEVPLEAGPGDLHDPEPIRGPAAEPLGGQFGGAPSMGDPFANEFPATPAPAPEPASAPVDDGEDLPWLAALDEKTAEWEPQTPESDGLEFLNDVPETTAAARGDESLADDDLAFLEELDRAISGDAPAAPPAPPPSPGGGAATPPPLAGTPAGRLICKECGAPNEPHSWYCEVCGSEL